MEGFNLLTEPWIPCLTRDGEHREVGIRDALSEAHAYIAVSDSSPLVTVAIHRLLLAVLHRVFGPPNFSSWRHLWEAGAFNPVALDTYLSHWHDHFFLLHEAHPFYQDAGLRDLVARKPTLAVTAARLIHERASGHNAAHFDHAEDEQPQPLTLAVAARSLLAHHPFAMGGPASGDNPAGKDYPRAGSLSHTAVVLARGETLFKTLLLNLTVYADDAPIAGDGHDLPAWEREEGPAGIERTPHGWLDVLTWQSRRILLLPEEGPEKNSAVRRAVILKGDQLPKGMSWHGWEAMVAFQKPAPAAKTAQGWRPVVFDESRALWRDSLALLTNLADRYEQPRSLAVLPQAARQGLLPRRAVPLDVLGLAGNQAKVLFWRHERLSLPPSALDQRVVAEYLSEALSLAEKGAGALRWAARTTGEALVAFLADHPDGRKPRREDIDPLVKSLAVDRSYWATLEVPFQVLLFDLVDEGDSGASGEDPSTSPSLHRWAEQIRWAALDSYQATARLLEGSSRGLKASALGERGLRASLLKVLAVYVGHPTDQHTKTEEVTK